MTHFEQVINLKTSPPRSNSTVHNILLRARLAELMKEGGGGCYGCKHTTESLFVEPIGYCNNICMKFNLVRNT